MSAGLPDWPDWARLAAGAETAPWGPLLRLAATPALIGRHCRGSLVYLATPYSREAVDEDGLWCGRRAGSVAAAAAVAAEVLRRVGVTAVSPIVQADRMVRRAGLAELGPPVADPLDPVAWERWCRPILFRADAVVVPPIAGRQRSAGVWREIVWALDRGSIPVWIMGEIDEG